MIRYLIEIMAFQLGFLIIYDLLLKKETFFQWNRAYLIGAFSLAMVLPSISLPVFRSTVTPDALLYPHFLIQLDEVALGPTSEASHDTFPWAYLIPITGSVLALIWFVVKLTKIRRLRRQGLLRKHVDHYQIQLPDSETAFSFFKNVFLGDRLTGSQKASILKHELVHVRQWHSLDLLFFELMRVMFWFNPLVYIYQKKTSELHEYLADTGSGVPKKEQYQLLLSETFGTRDISFINPFYKKSLLKKRIDMLRKEPSGQLNKFKYLWLLPFLMGVLLYTSCEEDGILEENGKQDVTLSDEQLIATIENDIKGLDLNGLQVYMGTHDIYRKMGTIDQLTKEDYFLFAMTSKRHMELLMERYSDVKKRQLPLPTTQRYLSYMSRQKAFKSLDKNLDVSIERRFDLVAMESNVVDGGGAAKTFSVINTADLTGQEVRAFNAEIEALKSLDKGSSLVLTDGKTSYTISKRD
ncbi:M56 family metallopeptidase [Sediminicola luteus]|uniref:Peptidase M56 domain-containing protein n=1 Tax=Sediminicola luteus TaxID=319238 RepID=A0A2A4GC24_9FLAO|nr:M56 family metallopeptidase [Sediminicola luteus]PCE65961.1 hypothetical protein B7P33_01270 [Sediminicola luteus]